VLCGSGAGAIGLCTIVNVTDFAVLCVCSCNSPYFKVMTNFFKVVAAVAPSPAESLQVAMPGLIFFILFNNFFVTKATVAIFMKWWGRG